MNIFYEVTYTNDRKIQLFHGDNRLDASISKFETLIKVEGNRLKRLEFNFLLNISKHLDIIQHSMLHFHLPANILFKNSFEGNYKMKLTTAEHLDNVTGLHSRFIDLSMRKDMINCENVYETFTMPAIPKFRCKYCENSKQKDFGYIIFNGYTYEPNHLAQINY